MLDADKFENDPELEQIRKDRNYNYQVSGVVVSKIVDPSLVCHPQDFIESSQRESDDYYLVGCLYSSVQYLNYMIGGMRRLSDLKSVQFLA